MEIKFMFFDKWENLIKLGDNFELYPFIFLRTNNVCYYLAATHKESGLDFFYDFIYKIKLDDLKMYFKNMFDLDSGYLQKHNSKCLDEIKKRILNGNDFVILEIFENKKEITYAKNIFTDKNTLDEMKKDRYLDHAEGVEWNIDYFNSDKNSKKTWERKRYANALDFGVKFLETYFKDDVEKFLEKESVSRKWIDENLRGYTIRN